MTSGCLLVKDLSLNETSAFQRDAEVIYLEKFVYFPSLSFPSMSALNPSSTPVMENSEFLRLCIKRWQIEWHEIKLS